MIRVEDFKITEYQGYLIEEIPVIEEYRGKYVISPNWTFFRIVDSSNGNFKVVNDIGEAYRLIDSWLKFKSSGKYEKIEKERQEKVNNFNELKEKFKNKISSTRLELENMDSAFQQEEEKLKKFLDKLPDKFFFGETDV